MGLVKLVGFLFLSSVMLVSCTGSPVHRHGQTISTAKAASPRSTQPPSPTSTTVLSTTTTITTTTMTPAVVPTTTQPTPEGSVRFNNAQAQTFGYYDGCNYVSFGIDNESNTTVDSVSVMFTLNEYGANGSYLDGGPNQGPYEVTVNLLPNSQRQLSVQVCPSASLLLPAPGDYFQVSGVSGTYTWAV